MTADDVHDILDKISIDDLSRTVLVLKHGAGVTIDQIARREGDYLVLRGRENGPTEEGRALFVPYEEILYMKVDRVVRLEDLKRMYGEHVTERASVLDQPKPEEASTVATPAPTTAMDPA